MVKCAFGGPKFLSKVLPVAKLDAKFQHEQCKPVLNEIDSVENAKTLAIICDGNRVNKKFVKMFDTVPGKPWLTKCDNFFTF